MRAKPVEKHLVTDSKVSNVPPAASNKFEQRRATSVKQRETIGAAVRPNRKER
jgi:hypothetical protein